MLLDGTYYGCKTEFCFVTLWSFILLIQYGIDEKYLCDFCKMNNK